MKRAIGRRELLALLHEDEELLELLYTEGLIDRAADSYSPEHAEVARVTGTLIHELEINWAGAEVILRLRSELVATRTQVMELLVLLKEGGDSGSE